MYFVESGLKIELMKAEGPLFEYSLSGDDGVV
jgi:hypothetical protein